MIKYWKEILIVILIVVILFSLKECQSQHQRANQNDHNLLLSRDSFNVITTKNGDKIYEQEQLITDKGSEVAKLIVQVDGLKKINQQVKIKTVITLTVSIPIDRPVFIDIDSNRYLKVPAFFTDTTQWYGLSGDINAKGGIDIQHLYIRSKPILSFGYKKKTFKEFILLKKDVPLVSFQDENPYTQVVDMSNVKIEDKWNHNWGVGIMGGYGVSKGGLSPFIGIGINYNLIKF